MGPLPWAGGRNFSAVFPSRPSLVPLTWLPSGPPGKPRSLGHRGAVAPPRSAGAAVFWAFSLGGVLLSPTPSSLPGTPGGSTGGRCRRGAKLAFGSPEWVRTEAGVQTWEPKVTRKLGKPDCGGAEREPRTEALLVAPDGSVRCVLSQRQKSRSLSSWRCTRVKRGHSSRSTAGEEYLESDGEDVFCIRRLLTSSWLHVDAPPAMHVHAVLFLNPFATLAPEPMRG
uniref:Uncharacterized protein n=1 Tax=Sphaerodactylus townsendi TaxID=933632 RepID=A0ACB8FLK8_9SAUR